MNYIKHLTGFFDKLVHDYDLNPTHVSLYISLFQFWNLNRFENPISITRDEVMRISKICSKATYHKCMRELHAKGYVIYEPSYNPFRGSLVRMVNLSDELKPMRKKDTTLLKSKQAVEQEINKHQTASEPSTEQALVSSINSINNTNSENILNLDEHQIVKKSNQFKNDVSHPELSEGTNLETKKKLREKKACTELSRSGTDEANTIPPEWKMVLEFFKEKNATEIEAEKFYNHFQSNGWLVGGKSKMKDWKAAARNWLLNANKFQPKANEPQANHLHTQNNKNYGEPL